MEMRVNCPYRLREIRLCVVGIRMGLCGILDFRTCARAETVGRGLKHSDYAAWK